MKLTTIFFIAFIAVPVFAHPVIKDESPVLERRKNRKPAQSRPQVAQSRPQAAQSHPQAALSRPPATQSKPHTKHHLPHIHIPHIHVDGKKVLKGFETAGEILGTIAAFFRRDLDHRALFDQGYEMSARRNLPRRSIDLEERDGHHAVHTAVAAAGIGLEIYNTFSHPNSNSKRELWDGSDELEARDFDDELEARDFDELEVRDFDDDLEAREFDDDFLDARGLDETLDTLDALD